MTSTGWTVWELWVTAPSLSNRLIIKISSPVVISNILLSSRVGGDNSPLSFGATFPHFIFFLSSLFFFSWIFSYKRQTNLLKKYLQETKQGKWLLKPFWPLRYFTPESSQELRAPLTMTPPFTQHSLNLRHGTIQEILSYWILRTTLKAILNPYLKMRKLEVWQLKEVVQSYIYQRPCWSLN